MGKILKIVASLLVGVILLLVVAAIALPLLIDPNDFRDEISTLVEDRTGRKLQIDGEIGFSVFPWLGIELGAMQLGNAPDFGDQPFAGIDRADLKIKLLPLLRKQVEIKTIILHGLNVNLARDKSGKTNWDDLVSSGQKQTPPEPDQTKDESSVALNSLQVSGIEIRDARLSWNDHLNGVRYGVQNLDMETGALVPGQPFPIKLELDVDASEPAVRAHLNFISSITFDLERETYLLDNSRIGLSAQGEIIPGGKVDLNMDAGIISADLSTQQLKISNLKLQTLGTEIEAMISGKQIIDNPQFTGTLNIDQLNLRQLLNKLAIELPVTADPDVLQSVTMNAGFNATTESAEIRKLDIKLDDTTLKGNAGISNFSKPAIHFDLSIDSIDADRYLPPPSKESESATRTGTKKDLLLPDFDLPLEPLRELNLQGKLRLGKLRISGLHAADILLEVKAKDGQLELNPLSTALYQGKLNTRLTLDARQDQAKLKLQTKLSDLQAGSLLKDLMENDYISGKADVSIDIRGHGATFLQLRQTMNGKAAFSFQDGAVKGINLGQMLRKGYAALTNQAAPEGNEPVKT